MSSMMDTGMNIGMPDPEESTMNDVVVKTTETKRVTKNWDINQSNSGGLINNWGEDEEDDIPKEKAQNLITNWNDEDDDVTTNFKSGNWGDTDNNNNNNMNDTNNNNNSYNNNNS